MDKRTLILNAMQELIVEDKGAACTVSDIAIQAGIGKGSIYYYFESKDEILDALVERNYGIVIDKCKDIIDNSSLPAIDKIRLLFSSYYSSSVENSVDRYLHEPQNAYIHQKSLSVILLKISPILTMIIEQGIQEKVFNCTYPSEFSELVLSEFCFIFDPGIFQWSSAQIMCKLLATAEFMERGLLAPKDSFSFLTDFPLLYQ